MPSDGEPGRIHNYNLVNGVPRQRGIGFANFAAMIAHPPTSLANNLAECLNQFDTNPTFEVATSCLIWINRAYSHGVVCSESKSPISIALSWEGQSSETDGLDKTLFSIPLDRESS